METYLERAIKKDYTIPWNVISVIAYDVAQTLHYLHSLDILHRQVSLMNILIKSGSDSKLEDVVLNDFATVATVEKRRLKKNKIYLAPETQTGNSTPQSDIWSLGVVLLELMTLCRTTLHTEIKDEKSEIDTHNVMRIQMQNMEMYPQEVI